MKVRARMESGRAAERHAKPSQDRPERSGKTRFDAILMAGTMAGLLVVSGLATALTACKDETMKDAIYDVKRQNEADLMALPGVVSVGIGRGPNGQPAIIVGMESAAPAGVRRVPSEISGYPVVIQNAGKLKAQ